MQRYEVPLSDSNIQLIWSFIFAVLSLGGWAGTIHGGRLPVVYGRWGSGPKTHTHTHTHGCIFLDRLLINSNYSTIRCRHIHICTKSVFLYCLTWVFWFFCFFLGKKLFCSTMWWQLLLRYSWFSVAWPNHLRWSFWEGFSMDTISVCPDKAPWSSDFCRSSSLSSCSLQVWGWMCTSCILESLHRRNLEVFWLSQDPFLSDWENWRGKHLASSMDTKWSFIALK